MAGALGANFSIDVTNLKAGLAQANRLIRESESEFKSAAAGMDDWSSSQEGLEAKAQSLNNITDIQRKKVAALQSEYENLISGGLDPASREATELRTKINNETAALKSNEKQLSEVNDKLKEFGKNGKDAGAGAESAGKGMSALGTVAKGVGAAVAAVGAACVAAVGSFFALAESTRESRTQMGKLETAFAQAGMSAETAESTFTALYGVLGDEGKATESAAFLAQYANTEEELAEQTRILTGVFATYGDSIPTEGLAEGIAATISMGETQGVLADALEWQGVNLEQFNEQLAACADEQEREALITSTLNGLYGEAADKYAAVNADIIAAQEAHAGMTQALNDLGAIAEPIMTSLKVMATDLLTAIMPFVSLMGEGLQGALDGTAGSAEKIAEGLGGMLSTVLDKIVSALPAVISTISALIPEIISVMAEILPKVIEAIANALPGIVTMLAQAIPLLITALSGIINQIFTSLAAIIPQIALTITEAIPQIITALTAAIPQLLEGAIVVLMAIVEALPVVISALVAALPGIITAIIDFLVGSVGILVDGAITLLMAIVEAIPVIIDALISNLPTIIDAIVNGLITGLPAILNGAIELFMAILEAIPVIIDALISNLPTIIKTIVSALINNIPALMMAAVKLFMAIVQAIPQIIGSLAKALGSIVTTIFETLGSGLSTIWEIGRDIVTGIWEGISGAATWLWDQITGWLGGIVDGIKGFLGINSPSRVMADLIGKNMALGIGEGFSDEFDTVRGKITNSIDTLTAGGINANINGVPSGGASGSGGVVVHQVNNYSQAHSRYEIYKSQEQTAAAVKLALMGV